MAKFSTEYEGDFGVPGIEIESTSTSIYDPYRGIDLSQVQQTTLQIYYWELLAELFLSICPYNWYYPNDDVFPCDPSELWFGEEAGTPASEWGSQFHCRYTPSAAVTVNQCTSYFSGRYGLDQDSARALCVGFDGWGSGFNTGETYNQNDSSGGFNDLIAYSDQYSENLEWANGISNGAWQGSLKESKWCLGQSGDTMAWDDPPYHSACSCAMPIDFGVGMLGTDTDGNPKRHPKAGHPWTAVFLPQLEFTAIHQNGYTVTIPLEDYWYVGWPTSELGIPGSDDPLGQYRPENSVEFTFDVMYNTDEYYKLDMDRRPSLGLFATRDNNIAKDNFTDNLPDPLFEPYLKRNLIKNPEGRFVKQIEFYTDSMGENSYRPQGDWDYIAFDGVGLNMTEGNHPAPELKKYWIQDNDFSGQGEPTTVRVTKYYWELMYELFDTIGNIPSGFPDSWVNDDKNVSIEKCKQFFDGKYGLYFNAGLLCDDLDRFNSNGAGQGGANGHIGMGTGANINSNWEHALNLAGFCNASDNPPCQNSNGVYEDGNPPNINDASDYNELNSIELDYETEKLNDHGYAGYYAYIPAEEFNDEFYSLGYEYEWASWQKFDDCHSRGKCLRFQASDIWDNTNDMRTNLMTEELNDVTVTRIDQFGTQENNDPDAEEQSGTWDLSDSISNPDSAIVRVAKIELFGDFGNINEYIEDLTIGGIGFGEEVYHPFDDTPHYQIDSGDDGLDYIQVWPTEDVGDDFVGLTINHQINSADGSAIPWSHTPTMWVSGHSQQDYIAYSLKVTFLIVDTEEHWSDPDILISLANNNEYRTNNQYQQIYDKNSDNDGQESLNPYSSLKVSFWMMTPSIPGVTSDITTRPAVESGITAYDPGIRFETDTTEEIQDAYSSDLYTGMTELHNEYFISQVGSYNSISSDATKVKSPFGSMARFKNFNMDRWEKMEYTFNLDDSHKVDNISDDIKSLYFLIQSSGYCSNVQWEYQAPPSNEDLGEYVSIDVNITDVQNEPNCNSLWNCPNYGQPISNDCCHGNCTDFYGCSVSCNQACEEYGMNNDHPNYGSEGAYVSYTSNSDCDYGQCNCSCTLTYQLPAEEQPVSCEDEGLVTCSDGTCAATVAECMNINDCVEQSFRGTVYLDDFQIIESYDFLPDVDVRKKRGPDDYGIGDLTKYYDPKINLEEYNDSTAPLEAQFYFYPKYYYNNPLDREQSIIYNDYRNELFYLYNVDWGDGTPPEFSAEPFKLGENIAVYHTYEDSGVFEITGTMLRMKSDRDLNIIGVANNQRFVLRININEGIDEDFKYFGSEGFLFIPFKNTVPTIGGYSNQSIYYKSIKRQLGIISDNISIPSQFKSEGDRLKAEIALNKMDSSYSYDFQLLNAFKEQRTTEPNGVGSVINNGVETFGGELGKSIGNLDITNIRYFNKPKQIWEMLGFENDEDENIHAGNPSSPRYWKKIIPQNYSILNRQLFLNNGLIDIYSQQNWVDSNYYYPVLPRYSADGHFIERNYPNGKIPFPLEAPATNESYIDDSLKISIGNEFVESNVYNDNSGNKNYGFTITDYKPKFNRETLKPEKTKNIPQTKTSKNNGAF